MRPWLISSSASVALPVTVSTTLVLNCAASRGPGTVANCQLLGSLKSNVPFVVTAHCFATLGIAQSPSPALGVNLGRFRPVFLAGNRNSMGGAAAALAFVVGEPHPAEHPLG